MTDNNMIYKAPKIKEIGIDISGILCMSDGEIPNGNEWMREEDLGDGGFH